MIILGIILIVAAAVFGADMGFANNFTVPDLTIFGQSLGITNGRAFFVIGVIVGAAIMLGISLLLGGMRRKGAKAVSRHKERKAAKHTEDDRESLRSDNESLRQQLDAEHRADRQPAQSATPVDSGDGSTRPGATRADQ